MLYMRDQQKMSCTISQKLIQSTDKLIRIHCVFGSRTVCLSRSDRHTGEHSRQREGRKHAQPVCLTVLVRCWIVKKYCWLVWCERKIMFRLEIYDRLRPSEQANRITTSVTHLDRRGGAICTPTCCCGADTVGCSGPFTNLC